MSEPIQTPLANLARIVCAEFGVTLDQLRCRRRDAPFVRARFAFCLLAYDWTDKSYPQIGHFLDRDHTTILHAYKRAHNFVADDPDFGERHLACVRELGGLC